VTQQGPHATYSCVSLHHFIPTLLAFVMLGLASLASSISTGWEERLQNDLLCVEWDVKS